MSEEQRIAAAVRAWRRRGGHLRITVTGRSMQPLLRPGDLIAVESAIQHTLRLGTIVVVQDAAGLLTHRLVRLQGETLVLWGDALPTPDAPVPAAALIGIAVARERAGRRVDLTGRPWARLGSLLIHPRWRPFALVTLQIAAVSLRGDSHP